MAKPGSQAGFSHRAGGHALDDPDCVCPIEPQSHTVIG